MFIFLSMSMSPHLLFIKLFGVSLSVEIDIGSPEFFKKIVAGFPWVAFKDPKQGVPMIFPLLFSLNQEASNTVADIDKPFIYKLQLPR